MSRTNPMFFSPAPLGGIPSVGAQSAPGKRFILRPRDLERIKLLRGESTAEALISRARSHVERFVKQPLKPWNAADDKTSWKQSKRYLGLLDMATLYLVRGDERYALACKRDVMALIHTSEANSDRILSQDYIEQRFINCVIIFILEWLGEFFTNDERRRIRATCLYCMSHHAWEMARSTVNQKLAQNHFQYDSTGLALVALYFNDFADADVWAKFGADAAVRYVRDAFNPDGAHNEVSVNYHEGSMECGLVIHWLLRDFGNRDLMREPWFRNVMERGLDWLASLLTPAGTCVVCGDSTNRLKPWLFRFGATHFQNPHFQACAQFAMAARAKDTIGYDGKPADVYGELLFDLLHHDPSIPAIWNKAARSLFPVSSTVSLRSGSPSDGSLLGLSAGSYSGGHAHRDRLNIEFWHRGAPLIRDPGAVKANWAIFQGWYKESSSHNVVAIHEPSVARFGGRYGGVESLRVEHRGHDLSAGRIIRVLDETGYSVLESVSETYHDVRQQRTIVWLKESGILLLADRIESAKEYVFDQLFHGNGVLSVSKHRFVFKNRNGSFAGSALAPQNLEIKQLAVPAGVPGSKRYAAVRARGKRILFLTLLEPFSHRVPSQRTWNPRESLEIKTSGVLLTITLYNFSPNIWINKTRVI